MPLLDKALIVFLIVIAFLTINQIFEWVDFYG